MYLKVYDYLPIFYSFMHRLLCLLQRVIMGKSSWSLRPVLPPTRLSYIKRRDLTKLLVCVSNTYTLLYRCMYIFEPPLAGTTLIVQPSLSWKWLLVLSDFMCEHYLHLYFPFSPKPPVPHTYIWIIRIYVPTHIHTHIHMDYMYTCMLL